MKNILENNSHSIGYIVFSLILVIAAISFFQKKVNEIKTINQSTLNILDKYSKNINNIDNKIQDLKLATETNQAKITQIEELIVKSKNQASSLNQAPKEIVTLLDNHRNEMRKEIINFKTQINKRLDDLSKRITVIENRTTTPTIRSKVAVPQKT